MVTRACNGTCGGAARVMVETFIITTPASRNTGTSFTAVNGTTQTTNCANAASCVNPDVASEVYPALVGLSSQHGATCDFVNRMIAAVVLVTTTGLTTAVCCLTVAVSQPC
eukprot:GHRR01002563.1.p2 GENE.GHRR01002563.1~~GHRR01002563.1.p2  ORF type:complete len:111 (+),score=21.31 GHRR01002563.1:1613-1945(+)